MMNLLIGNFDLFIWALSIRLLFSVSIKKIRLCNLKTDDGCTNFLKWRNVPKIIESLSVDGSTGQQIESSKVDPSTGAVIPSLSCHVLTWNSYVLWPLESSPTYLFILWRLENSIIDSFRFCDFFLLLLNRENLGVTIGEICSCSWWNSKFVSRNVQHPSGLDRHIVVGTRRIRLLRQLGGKTCFHQILIESDSIIACESWALEDDQIRGSRCGSFLTQKHIENHEGYFLLNKSRG